MPTSETLVLAEPTVMPFIEFLGPTFQRGPLRSVITENYRAPEEVCVARLLKEAMLSENIVAKSETTARALVTALRRKGTRGGMQELIQEFSLSSQEGVALMCLAEALLRIPDAATRDALIRDKIGGGDWRSHLGRSPSIFVNAATWGLVISGKLTSTNGEESLSSALMLLIARGGEPVLRKGVDLAMRMMGEQFVIGETISRALARSRKMETKGFSYSYDMLGEAAVTAEDAERYRRDYESAIHAIGHAAKGDDIYSGPGISIKLSALHPRFFRAQQERVMSELLPRVKGLAALAKQYNIGLNIDAEEADRLELSLDLLEALSFDPALAGWNGLGFVVQAYQKRAPFVLDFVIDLAKRSGHRLMVRLVKGAYWDSEIKRAQVDGLEGFPVFTRKSHTDVSYLACARKLLGAKDSVFPQFATHNAQTVGTVLAMAGETFHPGDYEFQCLHGMGEAIYEEIVGPSRLDRPCRIYAPVGTYETLLAYLVRRLLENGANSSFVNRIQDPAVSLADLVADPVSQVARCVPVGAPHPHIALPRDLFQPGRANSVGMDLTNETNLSLLAESLQTSGKRRWMAAPMLGTGIVDGPETAVLNPADHRDLVGQVVEATERDVVEALCCAEAAARLWAATSPAERSACLLRAADLIEQQMVRLLDLLVREAGKSLANAVSEAREAVDFLRYYGSQVETTFSNATHCPLGPVACISPWNFPLAIFIGQIAAALAAGNPVIAKPAEETPLIAAQAVAILREAGIPDDALQLLPGDGKVGAALVADARIRAVMFTGSTEVARLIQRELANRLNRDGGPVPLIAETGGQNALIVDSSALAEQVILDTISSAFDSAGQRCSALRVLCLQEDIADRTLAMLRGAIAELSVGNPDRLATDVGPVITAEARDIIQHHIKAMRMKGHVVHQVPCSEACRHGTFVPPTIIEISKLSDLSREVFGPVLHVLRFARKDLGSLIDSVNATGYGLTFGIHSRLDETIDLATRRISAGNIYVNRNIIGATVGVQPFGGHGLSGTGPKAGGPLYLRRLLAACPADCGLSKGSTPKIIEDWIGWLSSNAMTAIATQARAVSSMAPCGVETELAGPVGERNVYVTEPRGIVACVAPDQDELLRQIGTALATGNYALIGMGGLAGLKQLTPQLVPWIIEAPDVLMARFDAILLRGDANKLKQINIKLAALDGPITPLSVARADGSYPLDLLIQERSISINTAAAGGNASLMMIG
jgi:RHH-type transcriptional regulator, proline utilization regulon repressor / proline dehydrogenase / delta 1-pyrroline-5-carboxylate dehydrogenase